MSHRSGKPGAIPATLLKRGQWFRYDTQDAVAAAQEHLCGLSVDAEGRVEVHPFGHQDTRTWLGEDTFVFPTTPAVPPFDHGQQCELVRMKTAKHGPVPTMCPRCKNPHHACDLGGEGEPDNVARRHLAEGCVMSYAPGFPIYDAADRAALGVLNDLCNRHGLSLELLTVPKIKRAALVQDLARIIRIAFEAETANK